MHQTELFIISTIAIINLVSYASIVEFSKDYLYLEHCGTVIRTYYASLNVVYVINFEYFGRGAMIDFEVFWLK